MKDAAAAAAQGSNGKSAGQGGAGLGIPEDSRQRPVIGQTEGRRGHEDRGAGGGVEVAWSDDNDMQKL